MPSWREVLLVTALVLLLLDADIMLYGIVATIAEAPLLLCLCREGDGCCDTAAYYNVLHKLLLAVFICDNLRTTHLILIGEALLDLNVHTVAESGLNLGHGVGAVFSLLVNV